MFHTALGSGDAAGRPFTIEANRGRESFVPLPVFATRRGREADNEREPGGGVFDPPLGFSFVLVAAAGAFPLAARNVLLTETALNVAGFLTDEELRT